MSNAKVIGKATVLGACLAVSAAGLLAAQPLRISTPPVQQTTPVSDQIAALKAENAKLRADLDQLTSRFWLHSHQVEGQGTSKPRLPIQN